MMIVSRARVNARTPMQPPNDGRSALGSPARARAVLAAAIADAFGPDAPPDIWRLTANHFASLARAAGLPRDERRFRRLAASFKTLAASAEVST